MVRSVGVGWGWTSLGGVGRRGLPGHRNRKISQDHSTSGVLLLLHARCSGLGTRVGGKARPGPFTAPADSRDRGSCSWVPQLAVVIVIVIISHDRLL